MDKDKLTVQEVDQIICPTCGYQCVGKGGKGCIDKKGLYEMLLEKLSQKQETKKMDNLEPNYADVESSIFRAIESIRANIVQLDEEIGLLTKRLEDVCSLEQVEPEIVPVPEEETCRLQQMLVGLQQQVFRSTNKIKYLKSILQL